MRCWPCGRRCLPPDAAAVIPPPAPRAWAACSLGFALAALLLWSAPRPALDWQAQWALTQPWRFWTAAFVHWSAQHLQANLVGCIAVAAFGFAAQVPLRVSWAWLTAWPLTHALLALAPQLQHYGGLSGVLHAGVAVVALHLTLRASGRRRAIGGAVLIGLAVKLLLERPWQGPTQQVPGWDIALAPLAHVTGAASGLLCCVIAEGVTRRRARSVVA